LERNARRQPPVVGIADGGKFLGEPSLEEQQQLPVGRGRTLVCINRSRR
jgi:hypothetical protein